MILSYCNTHEKKMKTHPAPRITARLGNSSKLSASSDVIPNSCKTTPTVINNNTKQKRADNINNIHYMS